jgi:hypothetical protein
MNALTYDLRTAAATAKKVEPAAPKKGFWTRVLDALIEARIRQAEREIRMHAHLLPADVLAESGYRVTFRDADKLPFTK